MGSAKNGTQTAGLIFGGDQAPPPGKHNETESYNGTAWTELNNLLTARMSLGGAGTQTACLAIGGNHPGVAGGTSKAVESWDGTSWTEANDLVKAGDGRACNGTQTAALAAGGTGPAGRFVDVETWNGTSWTETANLLVAAVYQGSAGTSTAAINIGGQVDGTPYVSGKVLGILEWNLMDRNN